MDKVLPRLEFASDNANPLAEQARRIILQNGDAETTPTGLVSDSRTLDSLGNSVPENSRSYMKAEKFA